MINQVTSLMHSGGTGSNAATPQPRLVTAAHEFEAQLMKELLKPIGQAFSTEETGDDSDSGSSGVLGEFATDSLAKALSNQGGLGLANMVIHSLTPSGNTK